MMSLIHSQLTVWFSAVVVVATARGDHGELGFRLDRRIAWTTSRVVGSPEPPLPYRTVRAYPKLTLTAAALHRHRARDEEPAGDRTRRNLGGTG